MTYFETLKDAKGITDIFFERMDKYKYALTIAQELLREPSHLTPLDRELIAGYTSYLNRCEYCFGSHREFAKSLGATDVDLALFDDPDSHRLSPLLAYVKVLTLSPSETSLELKQSVIDAGFSEEELKDAIAVCAIFNFYNRIVEGHGVEANAETWSQSAAYINEHGYDRRY
jgi:uncharacterized peroxidase-related enzyme